MKVLITGLTLSMLALLGGCATPGPFADAGYNPAVTPGMSVSTLKQHLGEQVLWGGVIVATRNLENSTQLEILAYPLTTGQRPNTKRSSAGRFLALRQGYLEPKDYAAGREVTVLGTLSDIQHGRIGEAEYTYPVIQARGVHLWPTRETQGGSRVRFGFGIMLHN